MKFVIHKNRDTSRSTLNTHTDVDDARPQRSGESGFTLIETTIAMLLMLIVALGSASLFSFSIYNNSGGSDRALSLAIAQQAMEVLRGATFNGTTTDARLNASTVVQNGVIRGDNRSFTVTRTVVDNSTTLKSITITVRSDSIVTGWASGVGGTITLMSQRSRAD
ncbi:MAG TPA: prepilin-type N-terminal cleavage/methylation domain-containing protein [Pyrinomonadaceae bacterium]|nr:prepilin-type N-terminal cleavage/methylation domain-containing protein [Pyrinomonadaceae bacterium]